MTINSFLLSGGNRVSYKKQVWEAERLWLLSPLTVHSLAGTCSSSRVSVARVRRLQPAMAGACV